MDTFHSPAHAALRAIADALGVPVDRFFAEAPSAAPVADADACLRLWAGIRTEAGRRQALRTIAELERT